MANDQQNPENLDPLPVSEITTSIKPPLSNNKYVVKLPFDNPALLHLFINKHPDIVFKYLIRRIRKAIKLNWKSVTVFQFGDTHLATISQNKFELQLQMMMDWFIKSEDYESAGSCRDLIRKIKSSDVIDQPK